MKVTVRKPNEKWSLAVDLEKIRIQGDNAVFLTRSQGVEVLLLEGEHACLSVGGVYSPCLEVSND